MTRARRSQLLRDGLVFMAKLWLDSLKDLGLSVLALLAIILDFGRANHEEPHRFKRVLALGKRVDHWIDLYGPYDIETILPKPNKETHDESRTHLR
jgi:hypothetical protein